ncbi:hypothetical protein [Longivirga aurantiaca]|uniref:Uncharacterized protein n=1 Tax=Longivirga aurantiaca TaxID=1837743 RepID=A0ABW1SYA3_9ACTN
MSADPFGAGRDVAMVADLARQFGHHAGRAWFSGARADEEQGTVTVFRVPNHGFDSELRLLIGDAVPLVLEDATHTREELIVARETAWTLADSLQIEAITIPDDGRGINVYVNAPVSEAQAALDRYLPGIARAHDASLGVRA